MQTIRRRDFIKKGGFTLLAGSLAQTLLSKSLIASRLTYDFEPWVEALYVASEKLRQGLISEAAWQLQMDLLYAQVDLTALLRNIDFDKLRSQMLLSAKPEIFVGTPLRGEDSVAVERDKPTSGELLLINKIAHVKKGKCIPPHGHSNMVSAFLVISGRFRARQYDVLKVNEAAKSLWILPAMDVEQTEGQWTSISDERCNAHWLEALSDDTFLFSTKLAHIHQNRQTKGRIPFDAHQAKELGRGVLEVPMISGGEADRLYNG